MKILITGGSGFIGRAFIEKVVDENIEIYNIGSAPSLPFEATNLNHISFDFMNSRRALIDELTVKPDIIVHFAKANDQSTPVEQAVADFYVNCKTTVDLLEYGRKANIKKFILFSTGGVYSKAPTNQDLKINYGDAFRTSSYFFSKLSSEYYTKLYQEYFPTVILRPFFPYGPNQNKQRLIPRLIESIKTKHPITLKTKNGLITNPIHISDLVEYLKKILLNTNEAVELDLCGNEILSLRDMIHIIATHIGEEPIIECSNNNDEYLCGNGMVTSQVLGYMPQVVFRDGISNCLK